MTSYPSNRFPRLVHMGLGIVAVARSQQDLDRLRRDARIGNIVGVVGGIALTIGIIIGTAP